MKKRKWIIPLAITLCCFIAIIGLITYGVYWAFFDIQRIDGQEVITICESPDSSYTVTAYLNSGGATTAFSVLGTVRNNKTERERNIYWNYRCTTANINWVDDNTVNINGVTLDVRKDIYDYRRH